MGWEKIQQPTSESLEIRKTPGRDFLQPTGEGVSPLEWSARPGTVDYEHVAFLEVFFKKSQNPGPKEVPKPVDCTR